MQRQHELPDDVLEFCPRNMNIEIQTWQTKAVSSLLPIDSPDKNPYSPFRNGNKFLTEKGVIL